MRNIFKWVISRIVIISIISMMKNKVNYILALIHIELIQTDSYNLYI